MDNKEELIYNILHSVKFEYIEALANTLKVNDVIETNSCSAKKWSDLLSFYKIKQYDVVKKALEQAYLGANNATIDSLKAEIYDIGKDRNPSAKHIQALLQIIFEKNTFRTVNTLRGAYEIQKIFTLSQLLQQITNDDNVILYSKKNVSDILQKLDISILQSLHEKITSAKWINIDECTDEDYISRYLEKMDYTNLSFLHHNVECLYKYYDKIEFILKQLVYANPERLNYEYENLKKKRNYSLAGDCFIALNALKYEPPNEPITKEMIIDIEEYLLNFPDMESLIFYIGKLTPLKWNFLLLLIANYEAHPAGERVRKWLEKVQYDT